MFLATSAALPVAHCAKVVPVDRVVKDVDAFFFAVLAFLFRLVLVFLLE